MEQNNEMSMDTDLYDRARAGGLEIYFTIAEVAQLLLVRPATVRWYLSMRKEMFTHPPVYRRSQCGRRYRLIPAVDVKTLQSLLYEAGERKGGQS